MKKLAGKIIALLLILSLVAPSVVPSARAEIISKAEETKYGEKYAREITDSYGVISDPYIDDYFDTIAKKLTAATEKSEFDVKIRVVPMPVANAFAIPGGHVFLTTGIINLADDESEIVGVIAHEMGHVDGRHIAYRMEKNTALSWGTMALTLAAIILASRIDPDAAIGTAYIGAAAAQAKALSYSRADEEDADLRALRTLSRAGYDGRGLVTLMEKMRRNSPVPDNYPAYLLTHPESELRSAYLSSALPKTQPAVSNNGPFNLIQARVASKSLTSWEVAKIAELSEKNPNDYNNQLGMAVVLRALGKYTLARDYLEKATALNPDEFQVIEERSSLNLVMGKRDEAIADLEKLKERDGKFKIAVERDLGWAYLEAGKNAEALEIFTKLKDADPNWPMLHYQLGVALGRVGREPEAHLELGIYYLKKDPELAARHLNKAINTLPEGDLKKSARELLGKIPKKKPRNDNRETEY